MNMRQFRFSNKTTTDDHAIHLIGYKIDENEDWWFLIKDMEVEVEMEIFLDTTFIMKIM